MGVRKLFQPLVAVASSWVDLFEFADQPILVGIVLKFQFVLDRLL